MDYESAARLFATARSPHLGKPLPGRRNSTRLYRRGDDYAVQFHYTDVVTIHPNGTWTLDSGRWRTPSTMERINAYGPCQNYTVLTGVDGWEMVGHTLGHTPPKIQKCRKCHGTGNVRRWVAGDPDALAPCYFCDGTGRRDYGSKPIHPAFYDGIVVDGSGHVVGLDALVDA